MNNSNRHFWAIQDTNSGFIQYLNEAADKETLFEKMENDIGEILDKSELEVTEITGDQYDSLVECTDGTDQYYIDLLESYK